MKQVVFIVGFMAAAYALCAEPLPQNTILSEAGKRIEQYRKAEITLTLLDADGKPLPVGTEVHIEQTRHAFLFGCNIFMFGGCRNDKDNSLYKDRFKDLFNYATLGFYWASYEPQQGRTLQGRWKTVARWCGNNDIIAKGHPLFWTIEPQWVGSLPEEQGQNLLFGRIEREMKEFAGLVTIWDVLNEPGVGIPQGRERHAAAAVQAYETLGTIGTIQKAFDTACKADPNAVRILNDYDTSKKYEDIIEQSLAKNIPIDIIGIQSHMHSGCWTPEKTWNTCQRFARFGKPLHFTEVTLVSSPGKGDNWKPTTPDGEQRQAQEVAEFYTILFSHPAVEAITWWDLSDQGAWQKAPAGLIREDMSPKPAFDGLHKLLKETWWTVTTVKTDAAGKIQMKGFLGDYQMTAAISGKNYKAIFTLSKDGMESSVQLSSKP